MIPSEDKQQLSARLNELYVEAEAYFNCLIERPLLTFRRSGKHAGTAFLQQNRINLNPVLYLHNKVAFLNDVLPHEVSHLLSYQFYGPVKPHGREWQTIMQQVFRCAPNTTHNFDLAPLKLKSFTYQCICGEIELSTRRHHAILNQQRTYICKRCKQALTYKR